MSCYYPRLAVNYGLQSNGKNRIRFLPRRVDFNINDFRSKFGGSLFLLPCGRCLGCKVDKARDWSTRCVLESSYYPFSSFITLTYNDQHLPSDGKVHREDINQFIDKLKYRGFNFRFFGCAEYGSSNHRPHYHLITFGYQPDDLVKHSVGSDGNFLFTSKFLESVWSKGFVLVGSASKQSAGYVARYTTKKLGDDDSFIFMSSHPGIGYQYLVDHAKEIVSTDKVYGEFGESGTAPVPRYFNRFLAEWFPEEYQVLQAKRIANIQLVDLNSMVNREVGHLEEVKVAQAEILHAKLSRLGRDL